MGKRLTYEEVKTYCRDLGGDLLSPSYNLLNDKYTFLCSRCKKETFQRTFKSYRNNHICTKCSGSEINIEAILEKVKDRGYEVVEVINNKSHTRVKIKCECGNFFWKNINDLRNFKDIKCLECTYSNKNLKYTYEIVKEFIEKHKNFKLLTEKEDYINSYSKLHIKCRCGNTYTRTFNKILYGQGILCKECKGRVRWFKYSKNKIKEIDGWLFKNKPDYILISRKFHRSDELLEWKYIGDLHNISKENRKFHMRWTDIKYNNQRHPLISMSKGEEVIYKFLDKNNINFKTQYSFDELRGDYHKLKYDFAIFDKNNNLNYLCEYDGGHHFYPIDYYKGEDTFIKIKEYDSLKDNWAKKIKVKLIRIPYWEFDNIEKLLKKELKVGDAYE